ncbi:hypothetical protein QJS66_14910 [Kocuria rhizophila]|nr:hypothetical protein QJS66_14910 [Kocuria rhizophila]
MVIGAERTAPGLLQVLRPMAVQFAVFGSLAGLGLLIYAFVKGSACSASPPCCGCRSPWAGCSSWACSPALLRGRQAASLADFAGGSGTAYLWTDAVGAVWAVVLVVALAVLSVVCAALAWAHVRPVDRRVARNPFSWAVLPLAYFLLGLLLMLAAPVSGPSSVRATDTSAGFSVRPAGWTCLVFLLWGVVVELLARFGHRLHALPAAPVTRWLRGSERSAGAPPWWPPPPRWGARPSHTTARRTPPHRRRRGVRHPPAAAPAQETAAAGVVPAVPRGSPP